MGLPEFCKAFVITGYLFVTNYTKSCQLYTLSYYVITKNCLNRKFTFLWGLYLDCYSYHILSNRSPINKIIISKLNIFSPKRNNNMGI